MANERRRPKGPPKPGAPRGSRPRTPSDEPPPRKQRMKEPGEPAPTVFDVDRISKLVDLMKVHDLNEVELREGRQKIRICRGPKAPPPPPPPVHHAASVPVIPVGTAAPLPVAGDGPNVVVFKSPMVGTYYSKANPKSEPYVKVGSKVDANTIICIIEAMKVFNEIQADIRGEVIAILVQDGEAVDFEKPLFKIDTSK